MEIATGAGWRLYLIIEVWLFSSYWKWRLLFISLYFNQLSRLKLTIGFFFIRILFSLSKYYVYIKIFWGYARLYMFQTACSSLILFFVLFIWALFRLQLAFHVTFKLIIRISMCKKSYFYHTSRQFLWQIISYWIGYSWNMHGFSFSTIAK